ncbi:MAG: methyltransferase [Bacteroidales bacterium]|nr:methyltransferase [Bacteroidales bacterium]
MLKITMDSRFHFKQFSVMHDMSTMKVGTDAMLLGAWANIPETCASVLDIGTGCGVISLMIAQRTQAEIWGVDIHAPSIEQAGQNAVASPWADRLHFMQKDIRTMSKECERKFDLIVSNPPFFSHSLLSHSPSRNLSRHTVTLTSADMAEAVSCLLACKGLFAVILPSGYASGLQSALQRNGLQLLRQCTIYPKQGKPSHRMLLEFKSMQEKTETKQEQLCIRDEHNQYTADYMALTKAYHTIF